MTKVSNTTCTCCAYQLVQIGCECGAESARIAAAEAATTVKLHPAGRTTLGGYSVPTWTVFRGNVWLGIAHKHKGNYSFRDFSGSRARLIAYVQSI